MAAAHGALQHLISVRTGLVRTECYYILYGKANDALHLDFERKTDDDKRGKR